MKKLLILGASGSIGKQTIDVCLKHPEELVVKGIGVGQNTNYLKELLSIFEVDYAYSTNRDIELEKQYPKVKFYYGEDGLLEIVKEDNYDTFVNALVGFVGLRPTINAIKAKKNIALANKETLVVAGDIVNKLIKQYGVELFPIDSEHSAIYQCLIGSKKEDVDRLIITGSGGSFRDLSREELKDVTLEDALKHPTWSMGAKITIDSATMMNKGFEIMEAHYLYDVPYDHIDVLLHKESIVHSMVQFKDGSNLAQLSMPDMRIPIQYALLTPRHLDSPYNQVLNLGKLKSLNFKEMDYERYPLVKLVKEQASFGGNFGAYLNGANDETVRLFLNKKISFLDIEEAIIKTLKIANLKKDVDVDDVLNAHDWAKNNVLTMYNK